MFPSMPNLHDLLNDSSGLVILGSVPAWLGISAALFALNPPRQRLAWLMAFLSVMAAGLWLATIVVERNARDETQQRMQAIRTLIDEGTSLRYQAWMIQDGANADTQKVIADGDKWAKRVTDWLDEHLPNHRPTFTTIAGDMPTRLPANPSALRQFAIDRMDRRLERLNMILEDVRRGQ